MQIQIGNNEDLVITKVRRGRCIGMPNYVRFGLDVEGKCVVHLLKDASKGALRMFAAMESDRDGLNVVSFGKSENPVEQVTFSRSATELEKLGIIRKIPNRGIPVEGRLTLFGLRAYMMNPFLVIPRKNEDFNKAVRYWETVNETQDKNTGNESNKTTEHADTGEESYE